MRERIKWLLVSFGVTALLQLLISLAFTGIAFSAASGAAGFEQGPVSIYMFGFSLGAFLIGAFVIGWMSEEIRVFDAILVALFTLGVSAAVYTLLPSEVARGRFVAGSWLTESFIQTNTAGVAVTATRVAFTWQSTIFALLALVASTIGAYWGYNVKVPRDGFVGRAALLLGLIGVAIGPFVVLATGASDSGNPNARGIPGYVLTLALLMLLTLVGVGYAMFSRDSHYEDDISISPEHHKQQQALGQSV